MSPRRRSASNAVILEGAGRAVRRLGPVRVTLADVAQEVGLAPATLLQRFGSKRRLLLALAEQGADAVDEYFAGIRAAHPSPVAAIVAAATGIAPDIDSPESLANHLAFHAVGLGDPEFHRVALDRSRRIVAGYRELIEDAVAAGELAPCDAGRLARSIQAVTGGSMINWAVHRDGSLVHWLREDIDTLLAPYRREIPAVTPLADLPAAVATRSPQRTARGWPAESALHPRKGVSTAAGPRARHAAAAADPDATPRASRSLPRP